LLTAKILISL